MEIAKRIHTQQRNDKNKVYSVHASEVECIAKGKVHKRYEFGVKVGIVSTNKESFVVGMKSLPGNPYDGHMKNDGRLGRNFLKSAAGDAMNALLCGAGHNLRKILRQLAFLCARFGISFNRLMVGNMQNQQLNG